MNKAEEIKGLVKELDAAAWSIYIQPDEHTATKICAAIDEMQEDFDCSKQSEKEGWRYSNELEEERKRQKAEILSLRAAVADLLSGWMYIRQSYGDLYGVGWDRAEKKAIIALGALPDVDPQELGTIINNALSQES